MTLQRCAAVHDIGVRVRRDVGQPDVLVDDQHGPAVREAHRPGPDPEVVRFEAAGSGGDDLQRILGAGLVAEVQGRQIAAGLGEGLEVSRERNPRERLRKVVREALAVGRRVKDAVHVVKDRVLRDRVVGEALAEGGERRVADIVDALQRGRDQVRIVKDTPAGRDRPSGGSTGRTPGSGGRACSQR